MRWWRRFMHWLRYGKCDLCQREFRRDRLHETDDQMITACCLCLMSLEQGWGGGWA